MQPDQLGDILHLVLREPQAVEYARHHTGSDDVVSVESPPRLSVEALARRLTYVVQQGGPAQPQQMIPAVLGGHAIGAYIVDYGESMGEIVLMPLAVYRLHTLERRDFGQYAGEQPAFVHKAEGYGRPGCDEHLAQFVGDPLAGEYLHARSHAPHGLQGFGHYPESPFRSGELGGEAHGPEHPQGIVRVGRIRIKRGADYALGKVAYAAERVYQRTEVLLLQGEGHSVDSEVAAHLVVLEGAVLHYGLARLPAVRFPARPHELYLVAAVAQHGGAEVLEIRDILSRLLPYRTGEVDSAAFHDYIDVAAGPAEKAVPHIAAYHIGPDAKFGSGGADYPEYGPVKKLGSYRRHSISS